MKLHDYSYLKLAAQTALLYEVSPSLRGVAVEWIENTIVVYFYNDGEISEDLHDDFISAGTGIIAHYKDGIIIDEKIMRLDYPTSLPHHEHWVYRRKELRNDSVISSHPLAECKSFDLFLNTQKALLDKVGPSLRAVNVKKANNIIFICFYNDGEITDNLTDEFISISKDIIKNFNDIKIDTKIVRIDYPQPIPPDINWVYRRKE
jgi:hypothetical protein